MWDEAGFSFDDFDWNFFGDSGGSNTGGAGSSFDWTGALNAGAKAALPATISYLGHREVAGGNADAARIAAETARANIAEIRAANQRAAAKLRPISSTAGPALDYFKGVQARNPYDFTPAQRIELDDRARIAKNQVAPGLRGSARVNTAVINDVLNRARAGMIDTNQRRSDDAAGRLATAGVNATVNEASIESGQGPQIAAQNLNAGTAAGNAATGTAASSADTMGNIASFFANAVKDQERESRYKRYSAGEI